MQLTEDGNNTMIEQVWHSTFKNLVEFTIELEKVKRMSALNDLKPVWRIMKSIQLAYVPQLTQETAKVLDIIIDRLEIVDVTPSAWTEKIAIPILKNLDFTCKIDPVALGEL